MRNGAIGAGRGQGRWCILRTGGPRTLTLAGSLAGVGLEVWTPVAVLLQRVRGKRKRLEYPAPIMPTYVFARERHLPELAAAIDAVDSPHPRFSIFQWNGRVPLIADGEIESLRLEEAAAARSTEMRHRHEAVLAHRGEKDALRRAVPRGETVKMHGGPFAGLSGVVESGDRKAAWVNFGGSMRVKIDTWLLASDSIVKDQP